MKPSNNLLQAVAVTAELCGRTFSEAAARVFVDDLSGFPEAAVIKALTRCRKEVRGILTIQDVVTRIDDGHPGAEEAWAIMPFCESQSVVWTREMAEAFGFAIPLLNDGEKVAARMAFKEAYTRLVGKARDEGTPIKWELTPGRDPGGREVVLRDAVERGRLRSDYVDGMLPPPSDPAQMMKNQEMAKLLTDKRTAMPGGIRDALRKAAGLS